MKVVILNGAGGVGKDTFVEFCKEIRPKYVLHTSTVDYVKEVAKKAGWDGNKDDKGRKLLSDLKDLLTQYGDIPLKKVKEFCQKAHNEWMSYGEDIDARGIVFIDCREPEEIQRLVDELGAYTLLIRRPEKERKFGNHADDHVLDYNYDTVIFNDTTLDDLRDSAVTYLNVLDCVVKE